MKIKATTLLGFGEAAAYMMAAKKCESILPKMFWSAMGGAAAAKAVIELVSTIHTSNVMARVPRIDEGKELLNNNKALDEFIENNKMSEYKGYPIILAPSIAMAATHLGLDSPYLIAAIPSKKVIVVGPYFMDLPQSDREAFLAHEIGHIECGHGAVESFTDALRQEIEADAYATAHGCDMVSALNRARKYLVGDMIKTGLRHPMSDIKFRIENINSENKNVHGNLH